MYNYIELFEITNNLVIQPEVWVAMYELIWTEKDKLQ